MHKQVDKKWVDANESESVQMKGMIQIAVLQD